MKHLNATLLLSLAAICLPGLSMADVTPKQMQAQVELTLQQYLQAHKAGAIKQLRQNAQAPAFSGGEGTQASPYLIKTVDDLKALSKAVEEDMNTFAGKFFRMENDINLAGVEDLRPIGNGFDRTADDATRIRPFMGTFDGNNHSIRNFTFHNDQYAMFGFFGIVKGATIKNLTIASGKVEGDHIIGGIVGVGMDGTKIINCHTGKDYVVNCHRFYGGGIVGGLIAGAASEIADCTNDAPLTCYLGITGGLVGSNTQDGTKIERCGNRAAVKEHSTNTGGIIGQIKRSITIRDCYNTGEVSALNEQSATDGTIGGIIGNTEEAVDGSIIEITNCYQAGALIYSSPTLMDPIVPGSFPTTIFNSYYAKMEDGSSYSTGIGVDYEDMKKQEFVNKLNEDDASGIWIIKSGVNDGLPVPENNTTGIRNINQGEQASIAIVNGQIQVNGRYNTLQIYTTDGRLLPLGAQLEKGTYIVRLVSAGKNSTYKVKL